MKNTFLRFPNTLRRLKEYFKGKKFYISKLILFKDIAFFRVLIEMFIFGTKYLVLNGTSFGCDKTAESGFIDRAYKKSQECSIIHWSDLNRSKTIPSKLAYFL